MIFETEEEREAALGGQFGAQAQQEAAAEYEDEGIEIQWEQGGPQEEGGDDDAWYNALVDEIQKLEDATGTELTLGDLNAVREAFEPGDPIPDFTATFGEDFKNRLNTQEGRHAYAEETGLHTEEGRMQRGMAAAREAMAGQGSVGGDLSGDGGMGGEG